MSFFLVDAIETSAVVFCSRKEKINVHSFFFYKNIFYKNIEAAEICEILRIS